MQKWPTKEEDLQLAQYIIDKHIDFNDGNTLEIFECVIDNRLELMSESPDWVVEITHTFQTQYGTDLGLDISQKVLASCMIDGDTIH